MLSRTPLLSSFSRYTIHGSNLHTSIPSHHIFSSKKFFIEESWVKAINKINSAELLHQVTINDINLLGGENFLEILKISLSSKESLLKFHELFKNYNFSKDKLDITIINRNALIQMIKEGLDTSSYKENYYHAFQESFGKQNKYLKDALTKLSPTSPEL